MIVTIYNTFDVICNFNVRHLIEINRKASYIIHSSDHFVRNKQVSGDLWTTVYIGNELKIRNYHKYHKLIKRWFANRKETERINI